MANIAIVHWDLTKRGGAEAVSLNMIEALQDEHNLTLVTLRYPDWDSLNDYFNSQIARLEVRQPKAAATVFDVLSLIGERVAGTELGVLKEAVLCRYAHSIAHEFDLIVSSHDECYLEAPSIQYVHFPRHGLRGSNQAAAAKEFQTIENSLTRQILTESGLQSLYHTICKAISKFDANSYEPTKLLTNSEWTSQLIYDVYGIDPEVMYPPVDTEGFVDKSWDKRENGFVSLGRISSDKNLLRNIKIVRQLRERGHDIHLHIVGPQAGITYYRRVAETASQHEYVHLEGPLPREKMCDLLSRHKYGLHGKDNEHFGMVVAEFMVAGMIPFVPNDGGQREVVNYQEDLLYDSTGDAVRKIDRVLSDADQQETLKPDAQAIKNRFGRGRFKTEFKQVVHEVLQ